MSRANGVSGGPRLLLRLEGVALAVAAVLAYRALGAGWGLFGLALLAPDLAMLGYLAGPRLGAALYNAAHTLLAPALLAGVGVFAGAGLPLALALIWVAHIGIDRALGYGLKYADGFGFTHLGRIGAAGNGDGKPSPD